MLKSGEQRATVQSNDPHSIWSCSLEIRCFLVLQLTHCLCLCNAKTEVVLFPVRALFPFTLLPLRSLQWLPKWIPLKFPLLTRASEEQSMASKEHTTDSCNERRAATWQVLLTGIMVLVVFQSGFQRRAGVYHHGRYESACQSFSQ